jgi:hypothetical protein
MADNQGSQKPTSSEGTPKPDRSWVEAWSTVVIVGIIFVSITVVGVVAVFRPHSRIYLFRSIDKHMSEN